MCYNLNALGPPPLTRVVRRSPEMRIILTAGACVAVVIFALAYADRPPHGPMGFASRSQPTDCVNHLRIIDGAKEQFAIEHRKTNGESVTMTDLAPYLRNRETTCPAGGQYELRPLGSVPLCSLGTNRVMWPRERVLSYTFAPDSGNMHRLPQ